MENCVYERGTRGAPVSCRPLLTGTDFPGCVLLLLLVLLLYCSFEVILHLLPKRWLTFLQTGAQPTSFYLLSNQLITILFHWLIECKIVNTYNCSAAITAAKVYRIFSCCSNYVGNRAQIKKKFYCHIREIKQLLFNATTDMQPGEKQAIHWVDVYQSMSIAGELCELFVC